MAFEAKITKTDGTQIIFDLRSRSYLGDVNPTKKWFCFLTVERSSKATPMARWMKTLNFVSRHV